MRKLIMLLFVIGIGFSASAQLTEKQVIGDWKYTVETDQGSITGIVSLKNVDGKLTGEVTPDEGGVFALSKVEIQKENTLYFELQPEYEIMKVSVKIEGVTFKGTVGTSQGETKLTGRKIVDP